MTLNSKPLKLALAAAIASPLMISLPVQAENPMEKGLAISEEAKRRDLGWQDMKAQMQMVLRNKQGQESVREVRMKSLEVDNDGDKSLSVFDQPRDVKGTAFLSFSHTSFNSSETRCMSFFFCACSSNSFR